MVGLLEMLIDLNGFHQSCQLTGPEGAPVVCLSHSLASSSVMWDPQIPVLYQNFRVLRYDTRGHGGTDAPRGPYGLNQLGDDAVAMLDAMGIDRVHWVGLSMGGMIGQNLALRYPQRLASLMLCDTLSTISEEAQPIWEDRIQTAVRDGMTPLCEPTLVRWFTPAYLHAGHAAVETIRRQLMETPVSGYVGCCEAIRRLDYLDRLHEISLPVCVVVGAEDPAAPPSASEAIHQRIDGSILVTIDNAAHLSNVEQPEAFNAAMLGFLESR